MAIYSDVFQIDGVEVPQPEAGFSPLIKLDGVLLEPPAGKGWIIVGGLPWAGDAFSVLEDADPAAEVGDVIEWDLVTSPGGFDVTMRPDGTFVLDDSDDGTQQTFQYRLWRPDSGWTAAATATINGEGGGDGTPYDADLTRATASVQAKPVTVIESAPYVAELSAASFSIGGKPVTYQVITGYLAELSAAAFSVIGTAAFTSAGYVAQLGKAAFGLAAMPSTYTQAANYLAELTAAGFNVTAKVASTATGYVAQLGRATFSAAGKAAIWSGTFVADLTAAAFKAIGKDAEYETSLSYVAELTAALFKSSAAGVVTIATAFVARLEAALMAVRARVVTFTRPDGADGEVRRLIGKTGRRRGRRM